MCLKEKHWRVRLSSPWLFNSHEQLDIFGLDVCVCVCVCFFFKIWGIRLSPKAHSSKAASKPHSSMRATRLAKIKKKKTRKEGRRLPPYDTLIYILMALLLTVFCLCHLGLHLHRVLLFRRPMSWPVASFCCKNLKHDAVYKPRSKQTDYETERQTQNSRDSRLALPSA